LSPVEVKGGETIFALSSGAGRAGIAVIRISGPAAQSVVAALAGSVPKPRRAVLRALRDPGDGDLIDQGLVLMFPGPGSFTGEDLAEFQVHGGRATLRRLLGVLAGLPGCRLASPGEFTRRALLNGKMDLTAVEGLADLIAADTERQRQQALRQAEGVLGEQIKRWRAKLIDAMALVEVLIDFSDEGDVETSMTLEQAKRAASVIRDEFEAALNEAPRGERLRDGFRVVIAGAPNAGKSTLINALAKRDVAIVSAEPGTTRDAIEVALDLDGLPVILVDTAGIREAADRVEAEGVARAISRSAEADLVLWLTPVGESPLQPPGDWGLVWPVRTKVDSHPERVNEDGFVISALTGFGLAKLLEAMGQAAAEAMTGGDMLITRERHRLGLRAASRSIEAALMSDDAEIVAEALRYAAQDLAELLGLVHVEQVLDSVFARFCIGK
jgi:tRNA modification GTPase